MVLDKYFCLYSRPLHDRSAVGIEITVMRLHEFVNHIDSDLCNHIRSVGVQFMHFAFKPMNCSLLREFNLKCVVHLWATYISTKTAMALKIFMYMSAVLPAVLPFFVSLEVSYKVLNSTNYANSCSRCPWKIGRKPKLKYILVRPMF